MSGIYVPLVRQSYDYSCGAASLASCLYYWGVWSGREPELYPLLGTTCDGTKGESIIQVAQSFGLRVEYVFAGGVDGHFEYTGMGELRTFY